MDARTAESPVTSNPNSWLQRERASGRFYDRAAALIAAFLVTQLIALVLAWMRATRLFALMTVSAADKAMQHSQIVH